MTPPSPVQIAAWIGQTLDRIDKLVDEIREAANAAADDEAAFKREFAKARISARAEYVARGEKFTTDTVEDLATDATADLRHAHLLSANNLTVLREVLRAEEAKLDGLRTMSASVRVAGG